MGFLSANTAKFLNRWIWRALGFALQRLEQTRNEESLLTRFETPIETSKTYTKKRGATDPELVTQARQTSWHSLWTTTFKICSNLRNSRAKGGQWEITWPAEAQIIDFIHISERSNWCVKGSDYEMRKRRTSRLWERADELKFSIFLLTLTTCFRVGITKVRELTRQTVEGNPPQESIQNCLRFQMRVPDLELFRNSRTELTKLKAF